MYQSTIASEAAKVKESPRVKANARFSAPRGSDSKAWKQQYQRRCPKKVFPIILSDTMFKFSRKFI
jgi:hypothetical protein